MSPEPAPDGVLSINQNLQRKRRAAARALRTEAEWGRRGVGPAAGGPHNRSHPDEAPLFEVKTSAIGGDVDRAGSRMLVYHDRLELVDHKGRKQGFVTLRDLDRMRVRRRLTSVSVEVGGAHGTLLKLKGVRPAAADELRRVIASLKLELMPLENPSTPTASVLRNLNALAAMGLLTQDELAEKRAILSRQSVGR
ncbi:MAG: hypothetical protein KatS3mg008_1740 [Acidimicrobiales bacterium]|nr:MAG: hypothetical protein KatS3mg008_1740 [Acidimicrobiales bacterium]